MAISVTQVVSVYGIEASSFTAALSSVAAGDTLLMIVNSADGYSVSSITDTLGNSYSQSSSITANGVSVFIWTATAKASGSLTATVTMSGNGIAYAVFYDLNGVSGIVGGVGRGASFSSTNAPSVTFSGGSSGTFYLAAISSSSWVDSVSSPFLVDAVTENQGMAVAVASDSGAVTCTFSLANSAPGVIGYIAFTPVSAAAPTVQVVYFVEQVLQVVLNWLTSFQASNGRAPSFAEFQTEMMVLIDLDQLPSSCYVLRTEYARNYPPNYSTIGNPLTVGQ